MEGYDSKFDRKKYSSNRVRALSRTLTFRTISEPPAKVNPILLPNSISFRVPPTRPSKSTSREPKQRTTRNTHPTK